MILSILWPKLFTILFLLMFYFSVLKRGRIKSLYILGLVIPVLAVRDLLYLFFPHDYIMALSDIIVITIYLLWLRTYTHKHRLDIFYLFLNGIIFAAGVAALFVTFIPLSQFYISILIIIDAIYLAIFLGLVSEYNTENAAVILRSRFIIIAAFFLIHLVILLYGYSSPNIQEVIIPLSYFIHGYVLFKYSLIFQELDKENVTFLSNNLEALFDFMKNLGNAITRKIDLPRVMEIIVSSAVKNIGADAGAILMVDEFEDILKVNAIYGIYPPLYPVPGIVRVSAAALKKHFIETPIKIGETILSEAVRTGQPIMIRDVSQDERLKYNASDDILFISSALVMPLVVGNRVLGVLSILKRAEKQFFEERDFFHLRTFADYASITIDNIHTYMEVLDKQEMEREVSIAADIQQKLLPGTLPEFPTTSVASFSRPARGVSGDYLDIIPLDKDKVAMVVCDVAGKGVPAAMVMVMIRSILHLIVSPKREAATIIAWLNKGITGRIDIDHFATLGFLTFDQQTREVVYSNAAHPPLLVFRRKINKILQIDTRGLPVGIEKGSRYYQKRFKLEKGDVVILYTDGIIEAMNEAGEQYSLALLRRVLENNSILPANELVEKIESDLQHFVGNAKQHDDQSLLLMKVD